MMTSTLQQTIVSFFSSYHDGRAVLLALSGGADSLSLFLLLLEAKIPFHVAHVDHGWREESRLEAQALKSMVEKEGIPFHLHRLQPPHLQGNLELQGREKRFQFFEKICLENDLQAVVTAHHADDQAETVMIRFLTQAPLERFSGIHPVSKRGKLTLWRPLLAHRKAELEEFLSQQNKTYFEDKSNEDVRRMRASLRHQLIPVMDEITGRNVTQSLLSVQQQVEEVSSFLEAMAAPYLLKAEQGSLGWKWSVDPFLLHPQQTALLKFALRSFLAQAEFPYHRQIAEDIVKTLQQRAANRQFDAGGKKIYVDRGILMVPHESLEFKKLPWKIEGQSMEPQQKAIACSWHDIWRGDLHALLPAADLKLVDADLQALYPGNQPIRFWWNKHKIPACMRTFVPLVVNAEGKVVHEFLTGKVTIPVSVDGPWMRLCLKQGT